MGDEISLKKLSKILSILIMLALLVTINFDVYAKTRSGGFKSSGSTKSSSSSTKSSSSSSSGTFKSSSNYKKPSTTTTKKPSTSTNTSDVNKSSSNSRSKTPIINSNNNYRSNRSMGLRGLLFSSILSRMVSGIVIIVIIYLVYKSLKRRR